MVQDCNRKEMEVASGTEEKSRNTYVVMLTRETLWHSWIVQY